MPNAQQQAKAVNWFMAKDQYPLLRWWFKNHAHENLIYYGFIFISWKGSFIMKIFKLFYRI